MIRENPYFWGYFDDEGRELGIMKAFFRHGPWRPRVSGKDFLTL
jgi:hypothetical protein